MFYERERNWRERDEREWVERGDKKGREGGCVFGKTTPWFNLITKTPRIRSPFK